MAPVASPNDLSFQCDWRYGFNLSAQAKGTVGYLLFWSGCGGLNLASDVEVWNPFTGPGQTVVTGAMISCVGLIEKLHYSGDESDPIRIAAYVSKGTAANVRAKLTNPLTSTVLKVGWYVIAYDDDTKAWYEAAFVRGGKAAACIDTADGALQMSIANEGTRIADALDITVFKFEFQVVPAAGQTALLQFATGPSTRIVRQWQSEDEGGDDAGGGGDSADAA